MALASFDKAGQILCAARNAALKQDQSQNMFRPTNRLGPALYVMFFVASTGLLTLGLVAIGLVFAPGSADLVESFYSRYVYRGTAQEVDACIRRHQNIADAEVVSAFCRGRHSRSLPGQGVVAESLCTAPDKLSVTVRNISRRNVVTGFSLQTQAAQPTVVRGDWITPGESRSYELAATCDPAIATSVAALAQRGLVVNSQLAVSSTDSADRLQFQASATVAAPVGSPDQEERTSRLAEDLDPDLSSASKSVGIAEPVLAEAKADADAATGPSVPKVTTKSEITPQTDEQLENGLQSVSLRHARIRIRESDGGALIPVDIHPAAKSAAWIEYMVIPETARSSQDFAGSLRGRVNVEAGEAATAVMVPMVNDSLAESDESFTVRLAAVSDNLYLPGRAESQVDIVDDD